MDESAFARYIVDLLLFKSQKPNFKPDKLSEELVHNFTEKKLHAWIVLMNKSRKDLDAGNQSMLTPRHVKILQEADFPWEISQGKRWNSMFQTLTLFAEEQKHSKVPRNHPKLGAWVNDQRKDYGKYKNGKPSSMNEEKIRLLESVKFTWKIQYTWEERCVQLADYKESNGNCNVPTNYNEDPGLGRWVKEQRSQKKMQDEGKESKITLDQIAKLDRMGFKWAINKKRK